MNWTICVRFLINRMKGKETEEEQKKGEETEKTGKEMIKRRNWAAIFLAILTALRAKITFIS